MSEYLTTKEVADLLRLKERKVYDLAARGEIPCVKATGKLLFPRLDMQRWMESRGGVAGQGAIPQTLLGSHDPLLEWALGASGSGIPTLMGGSLDGLSRFTKREGAICGLHIPGDDLEQWNIDAVETECSEMPVVLMHWAKRRRGLIVRSDCSLTDFASLSDVRFVGRQADSGSHQILAQQLMHHRLEFSDLNVVREARTETEAALLLVEGQADVTFGLECFASRYQLKFVPVCTEWFDLLVDRHAYFEPSFQRLLQFTRSDAFLEESSRFVGYDIGSLGQIRFNGAR